MTREKPGPMNTHGPCAIKAKGNRYNLMGRIWVEGKDGTFLGHGRVKLLERIREYGSITEAAKSLDMSYRHAWDLVESMNSQAKRPLVETATGGKGGGGTRLTDEGEKALRSFSEFHRNFQIFLEEQSKKLMFNFL